MENMDNIEKKTEQPDTTPVENAAPEIKAEPEVKVEAKPEPEAAPANQKAQTEDKPVENDSNELASDASTKFTLTVKQVWNVIKGFCSKDAVNTISSQYDAKFPIWSILLPVYILLGASSQAATYSLTSDNTSLFFGFFSKTSFASGEIFFATLAILIIYSLVFSLGIRSFIKFHGGDGHFANSANLFSATTLPITMIYLLNVVTGGALSFILTPLSELATVAMFMMLFSGMCRVIGGKKPIWSFFLLIIIVVAVTAVVSLVVISPIIFSSVAYEIIDKITK